MLDLLDLIHGLRGALAPVFLSGIIAVFNGDVVLPVGCGQLPVCLLQLMKLGRAFRLRSGLLRISIPGRELRLFAGQLHQPGSGDRLLIHLSNQLPVAVNERLKIGDLTVQTLRIRRIALHLQTLGLQPIDLLHGVALFPVEAVGILDLRSQRGVGLQGLVQLLTVLVNLGDAAAQRVVALPGLRQRAVRRKPLGGGEQRLDLGNRRLQSVRGLLPGFRALAGHLLNLAFEAGQHLPNLLFHHVAHVQVDARADGFQQIVRFADVFSQPGQIQILCADQLVLALRHVLTTLSSK